VIKIKDVCAVKFWIGKKILFLNSLSDTDLGYSMFSVIC